VSKRISHSLLDRIFLPMVPYMYRVLPIPRRFPPEGIVVAGHLIAIGGAFAFAYSTRAWWAGALAAAAVAGNHLSDMIDGTHARSTDQCRNGGELLDHFLDPFSFAYWMIGIAVSTGMIALGFAAVIVIFATAVLTSIRAKMVGEFILARFGPTEFKALLAVYGIAMAVIVAVSGGSTATAVARVSLWALVGIGVVQLVVNLGRAMRQVNSEGGAPDTGQWQITSGADAPQDGHGPRETES
jgi:phosphatidylglycerophosphate synthase